jgi:hypothetical protein
MVVPLLATQFAFILLVRLATPDGLGVNPFREQLTMGMQQGDWVEALVLFLLLSVVFLLTALTFVPIGQLCGRLMERWQSLRAYGLNLVGSLLGVVAMLVASFLWTPPLVWFAVCFLVILLFHVQQPSSLIVGIVFSIVGTIVLAWWPINPLWSRVYSPYQLLEIGTEAATWVGVGAPRHTPAEIIDKLNHEINAGLADPKIEARFADLGYTIFASSPADFGNFITTFTEKWARVFKSAGVKAN